MKIVEEHIPDLIRNQQDKEVIDHLYIELFPTVKKYICSNKGNAADAYDVFQDAIIYFYKQISNNTFDAKYTVYGYLYRLAKNRWINKLNKDKKIDFNSDIINEQTKDLSYNKTTEEDLDQNILNKFLTHIGNRCVELLTHRIYSNLMFEDIVIRMEFKSEAAAKMSFKRCREKLVEVIKSNPSLVNQHKI